MGKILDTINEPGDLKGLSAEQLGQVADEVRELILEAVSTTGGHLASNLGVADLTVALHYTFDFRRDMLIWDVGHQCYAHKILTGRRDRIHTVRQHGGLAGFPDPGESEYDSFHTSHAGVSISTGLGVAVGDDLMRRKRKVVCVIGDGSMTGGLPMEALNNIGEVKKDLLIILNHNQMSISRNVGALSAHLDRVRTLPLYLEAKKEINSLISLIPSIGVDLGSTLGRVRDAIRHGIMPSGTIFEQLGMNYYGPVDGHDMDALLTELQIVQDLEGPTLLHVVTQKGHGCDYTEDDPVTYHSPTAFDRQNGSIASKDSRPSYSSLFGQTMTEFAEADPKLVAITAAMAQGTGLEGFAERFPERFFDVGIAEQHAVAFAAGLAKGGLAPVAAIYSSFLQRAYDQVFHEVCLQNLPVVFAIDRAGITGGDGATAQGNFDIAYLRNLPQMTVMAPRNGAEFKLMFRFAIGSSRPVAIRYPRATVPEEAPGDTPQPIEFGKAEPLREGTDVALLALGAMVPDSLAAAEMLEANGTSCAVINARFAKPVDSALLADVLGRTPLVVTVEDHALDAGFGSAVLEAASDNGLEASKIRRLGIPDRFIEHGNRRVLMEALGLCPEGIAESVKRFREDLAD